MTCRQLRIDKRFGWIMMVMVWQRTEMASGYCPHWALEDNSLIIALALSLRLDTVVAYRLSLIALDAPFSTRCCKSVSAILSCA